MSAVFLLNLLYTLAVCDVETDKVVIPIAGFVLFLMSYIKQTKYVSKNMLNTIKNNNDR